MLKFLLLIRYLLTYVSADHENKSLRPNNTRRIYFGEDAMIEDYPCFASLSDCGAVILSEIWIATVAHCVDNAQYRGSQEVYVGGNTFADSIKFWYTDFIIHPDYRTFGKLSVNDIALLKLNAPLQFSERIQPALLPTSLPPRAVVHVGRGRDETGMYSVHLKKTNRILLTTDECLNAMSQSSAEQLDPQLQHLQSLFLCSIRSDDVPSVCAGDSGSPMLSGNTLVALHSSNHLNCYFVGISMEVYILNYVPWIKYITGL